MRTLLFLIFLFLSYNAFSQFENRYWTMGYSNYTVPRYGGTNIDFFHGQPDTFAIDRDLNFNGCASNISSASGRFLFATNGAKIGDASNHIMVNGDSLICLDGCDPADEGSMLPQQSLIIPDPADTNLYYVFYNPPEWTGISDVAFHLYYAKVDMRLNNGLGAVTAKNISIFNDSIEPSKLTACKHGNGHDWWIVVTEVHGPKMATFLLSDTGIQLVNRQPIGIYTADFGYSCFSPDGNHYASFDLVYGIQLFDFDRCTGLFSFPRYIPYIDTIPYAVGVSFSPNSRYLYISNTNYIYQYDIQAVNIPQSKTLVGIWDGALEDGWLSTQFFYMALARDGKIYINTGSSTHSIHRIEFPDLPGVSCHFQQRYLTTPKIYFRSIPNHPNYQLGPDLSSGCSGQSISDPSTIKYSFSIFPNPSPTGNISIEFNHVGIDKGKVELFDIGGRKIYESYTSPFTSVFELNNNELSKGIYFIKLSFSNWSLSQKLIIE